MTPSAMPSRPKRINGFDKPYSRDQIVSTLLYIFSVIGNFSIMIAFLEWNLTVISIFIAEAVLTVSVMMSWGLASSINPELVGNEFILTQLTPHSFRYQNIRTNYYCLDCNKTIFQLDHHCSFLNTCIGGKNYPMFIILIVAGALQMSLHVLICIIFGGDLIGDNHTSR
jgi:palmitoyltransferase